MSVNESTIIATCLLAGYMSVNVSTINNRLYAHSVADAVKNRIVIFNVSTSLNVVQLLV